MKRKFYLLFTALLMMAATSAWADTEYAIGQRILGIDEVEDGELVVIEAASSTKLFGNYITASGSSFTWNSAFDSKNSVWKLISTETENQYYLYNIGTKKYMGGGTGNPTLVETPILAITLSSKTSDWFSYTSQTSNPQGWDDYSIVMTNSGGGRYGNDVASGGSFASAGWHASQWNFYKAVEKSATYKVGDRKRSFNELHNGDLIYIQAAAVVGHYGYFIQETTDGTDENTVRWKTGTDNNSVWRVVAKSIDNQSKTYTTNTLVNGFYLQNVASNYYIAKNGSNVNTVSAKSSAATDYVYLLDETGGLGEHFYDNGASNPRGCDEYSFNIIFDDWIHNDVNSISGGELFGVTGTYNAQWNIYAADIVDGTGEVLNPGQAISSVSDIKPNRTYTLTFNMATSDKRGGLVVNSNLDNAVGSGVDHGSGTTTIDASNEEGFNQWIFKANPNGDGTYYLYNAVANKYLTRSVDNSTLTSDATYAFNVVEATNYTGVGHAFLMIPAKSTDKNRTLTLWSSTVYINGGHDSPDVGNWIEIAEAALFDPSKFNDTEVVTNLTLTDDNGFAPTGYSFTANTATYTRENLKSKWGTIMLPYDVDANDDVAFYSIDSESGGVLTVTKANKLTAGTPALFKTNGATSVTFSASPATVKPTTQTATGGGLTLVGTYTKDTIDVDNTYYIKDDKFYSKGDGINFIVNPFRAYMKSDGSANSNAFSIVVDDDPTGITTVATSSDASDEIEGVYSVNGVKLSDLQKGINIIRYRSGKTQKVILK